MKPNPKRPKKPVKAEPKKKENWKVLPKGLTPEQLLDAAQSAQEASKKPKRARTKQKPVYNRVSGGTQRSNSNAPRVEAFAQHVATGMLPIDAYRALSGGKKRPGDGPSATKYLKIAKERIAEIQKASNTAKTLTMQESREFLARVVRANLNVLDMAEDGDLIQEISDIDTAFGSNRKVKLPGKKECIQLDAQLGGYLVEKVEHSGEVTHVVLTEEKRAKLIEKKRLAIERAKGALEA